MASIAHQLAETGFVVLPSFLSTSTLTVLQRECDRLAAGAPARSSPSLPAAAVAAAFTPSSAAAASTAVPSDSSLHEPDEDESDEHEDGYVLETTTSGSLSDAHPARVCAVAYVNERLRCIRRTCSRPSDLSSNNEQNAGNEQLCSDNAAVCDLLFRHPLLLSAVSAVLRHDPSSSTAASAAVASSSPSSSSQPASSSGVVDARQVDSSASLHSPQAAAGSKRKLASPPASPSSSRRQSSDSTTIASSVFLFNEQYVCKPAHRPSAQFGWHTDAAEQLALFHGQTDRRAAGHPRYVACWFALDDMTQSNGTLRIVPRTVIRAWEETSAASGVPAAAAAPPPSAWLLAHSRLLLVPSGSAVLFDGDTWHASAGNESDKPRRVFYAQYSSEPIATRKQMTIQAAYSVSFAAPNSAVASSTAAASVLPSCAASTAKRQRRDTVGQAASVHSGAEPTVAAALHATTACPCCHTTTCAALLGRWDVLSFAIPCGDCVASD
jgi:hypothetical protein